MRQPHNGGLLTPIKDALGRYLAGFYAEYSPDTPAAAEWAARGIRTAMAFVPDRMIDAADDMLSSWRRNTNAVDGQPQGGTAYLPVVLIAMGKDWTPILGDYGRQVAERLHVMLPGDELERAFKLRVMQGEVRVQLAIFAADGSTAGSIAAQLALYLADMSRRTFQAVYSWAGRQLEWPVQVQTPDVQAVAVPPAEQTNLTIITVDVTLRCSIPLFDAPVSGQPNDGQGVPGDFIQPPGFPVVVATTATQRDPLEQQA